MLLLAVTSDAQVTAGPNSGMTFVITDGESGEKEANRIGDLFTQVAVDFPIGDGPHAASLVLLYDGDDQGGFGLRYFNKAAPGFSPGLGVSFSVLGDERPFVDELTILLGGEFLIKASVPVGDRKLPLLLGVGAQADIVWTDVTVLPITASVPLELLQGG